MKTEKDHDSQNIKRKKELIRQKIWELLERENIARFPRPVYGRIPNFMGAEKAAINLRNTPEWKKSQTIFVNPDAPQKQVRFFGLLDKKRIYMATPRIKKGFLLLDPTKIPSRAYTKASTIKGAFRWGLIVGLDQIEKIDIKVTGCVAVDPHGGRLGKGHGYSDIEWGILSEIGVVDADTITATTVHDMQIVDRIPMESHDFPIDIIATPTRIIYTQTEYQKPKGIIWEEARRLFDEIPILRTLYNKKYR